MLLSAVLRLCNRFVFRMYFREGEAGFTSGSINLILTIIPTRPLCEELRINKTIFRKTSIVLQLNAIIYRLQGCSNDPLFKFMSVVIENISRLTKKKYTSEKYYPPGNTGVDEKGFKK